MGQKALVSRSCKRGENMLYFLYKINKRKKGQYESFVYQRKPSSEGKYLHSASRDGENFFGRGDRD